MPDGKWQMGAWHALSLRRAAKPQPNLDEKALLPGTVRVIPQDPLLFVESNAMTSFLHRFGAGILGVLSGFDRIRFRGTLPRLADVRVFSRWLQNAGVLLKGFAAYATKRTEELGQHLDQVAQEADRSVLYLAGATDKEKLVQQLRERDGVAPNGLICVLKTLESCVSYEVRRNAQKGTIDLQRRPRKCSHYYVYFVDPQFGLAHVRLQSWFPFHVNVVLNGREWLARQLDENQIDYQRRDNCFTWIENFERAQALANEQPGIDWQAELDRLLVGLFPSKFLPLDDRYYWTVDQSEWATDLSFRSSKFLAELHPQLVHRGIETFRSEDVLRFLGHWITPQGQVPPQSKLEITSDIKHRPEGVRIKHRAGRNSIKLYDKQGSVLRVETTLNAVKGFKSFRPATGDPDGPPSWRPLRKGVADMARRADLSQASNERYIEALGSLPVGTPLGQAAAKLCSPVFVEGRRYRALNPLAPEDTQLLQAISRGEWATAGFRNRDIRHTLYGDAPDLATRHRQAARISRLLGLLHAHKLIKKIPHTHRYLLTAHGTSVIPALLAASQTTLEKLVAAA